MALHRCALHLYLLIAASTALLLDVLARLLDLLGDGLASSANSSLIGESVVSSCPVNTKMKEIPMGRV